VGFGLSYSGVLGVDTNVDAARPGVRREALVTTNP
jgi:hypothetical protein